MELSSADFQGILSFTKDLARRAGALILQGSTAILSYSSTVSEKNNNPVDLVTEWDVRVEAFVKSEIAKEYPTFQFIGEESYSSSEKALTDTPTFCVDPIGAVANPADNNKFNFLLDGTTNFVHGFPFVCISLGLLYKKRPMLGVIYNPFLDQLYSGLVGHGSYLTQGARTLRLPLSQPRPLESLSKALIAIEWGSDRSYSVMAIKSQSYMRLAGDSREIKNGKQAHSLRSVGSAALNFAMVASGSLDIYWEIGCWPWDVCAGMVVASEAGALVSGSADCTHDGVVTEQLLTGRKYIVVRGIPDDMQMTGYERQQKLLREFYETVEEWSTQN